MESVTHLVWGIVLIAAGVFLTVYGGVYFRFALAAIGFGIGFLGSIGFTVGQDLLTRFVIALIVGIAGAGLLYFLVQFSFVIAGAVFGLIVALVLEGIIQWLGPDLPGLLVALIALVGLGGGAYFGKDLGQLIVVLATTAAGAYLIVSGISVIYDPRIEGDGTAPLQHLSQGIGLLLFAVLFVVGYLTQSLIARWRPVARAR